MCWSTVATIMLVVFTVAGCAGASAAGGPPPEIASSVASTHVPAPTGSGTASRTSPTSIPISDSSTPAVTAHIAGHAFEILGSAASSSLWVPEFNGTDLRLDQFGTAGKLVSTTQLGASGSSGINSHIRQGPGGTIWVADDYVLYAINPKTKTVHPIRLSPDDPHAHSDALSDELPLPGTWVSAFTFDSDGHLVIARNNVPVLEVLSSEGRTLETVPLPEGVSSISDMNLDISGLAIVPGHSPGLESATPGTYPVTLHALTTLPTAPLRSSAGGFISVFFPDGEMIQTDGKGDSTKIADGSTAPIRLAAHNLQVANPLGVLTNVTAKVQVAGAAPGPNGHAWLLLEALGGGTDLAVLG